jgi:N-acetylmuramoyl-L-alanine amidase
MVLTAITAFSVCEPVAAQHKNFILVIDAGHGGQDPGATHGRYLEKNLNLEIALSLGASITRNMTGVDVLYTRTDDRAVGLAARGDFANRAGADLFLSIHTNANRSDTPSGSETYVMGMDKSDDNLAVAKLENEVIRYEADYATTYAAFDPNSTEMSIIMGMTQYANFESSIEFARMVQKHLSVDTPLRDRGAKQGPFAVLWKPTMPRVLVEMGFISNDADRRYIFSERGKEAIVRSLFEAFGDYKKAWDVDVAEAPVLVQATPAVAPPLVATPDVQAPTPVMRAPEVAAPAPVHSVPAQTPPAQMAPPVVEPPIVADPPRPVSNVYTPPPTQADTYIQLSASRSRVSIEAAIWGYYRGRVVERYIDGWYKYALGPFTASEAASRLGDVRRNGFRDAFIVK